MCGVLKMNKKINEERIRELVELSKLDDNIYLNRVLKGDLPLDETALYRIIRLVLKK